MSLRASTGPDISDGMRNSLRQKGPLPDCPERARRIERNDEEEKRMAYKVIVINAP